MSFSCLPQLFRPLASPSPCLRALINTGRSPPPQAAQSRRTTRPRPGRFVPFPAPATDGDERRLIDLAPVSISSSPFFPSPPLSHRAARILSGQGFSRAQLGAVLNTDRGKEDRTRCWTAGGRLLSVASVSVKRRRRLRPTAETGSRWLRAVQCCRGDGNLSQVSGLLLCLSSLWLFWFFCFFVSLPRLCFPSVLCLWGRRC